MIVGMATVEKVTISLPADLLAFVEAQRAQTGTTRSEFIADYLREVQRRIEQARREERYAIAYGRHPETADELAFTDAATEDFFAGDHLGVGGSGGRGAEQVAAIRAWARAHGYIVAEKGASRARVSATKPVPAAKKAAARESLAARRAAR
jgi:Arc/MetJ-type ribon-helix-helix transcriptional regulator